MRAALTMWDDGGRRARAPFLLRPDVPRPDLQHVNDAQLVAALRAGEAGATRVVWDRFAPLVQRILQRDLGGRADIEDLTQDVFMKLFERIPSLRDPAALRSFIISITTLTLRDEIRKRQVRRWVTLVDAPLVHDRRSYTPDPESRQALLRLYRILERFGPEDRSIAMLRFVQGRVLTDTAAAMGLSLSTTKRRLSAVWKRLSLMVAGEPALTGYMPVQPATEDEE